MPPYRAANCLSKEEYREVLEPALAEGIGSFRLFTWMTPGEVKILGIDRLDEAKSWVAGGG